jgi:hypothetical protein
MANDILRYEDYFLAGTRIQVEIPLPGEKVFRDDAEVVSLHHDLLQLRLSRTILPESAILDIGTPLYVRTGQKGVGFRCRGIVLEYGRLSGLFIRLTGEILSCNDREYFRIDVYIPLGYRACAGESHGEAGDGISAEGLSGLSQGEQDGSGTETGRKTPLPVAANLSGAGVRIHIPHRFHIDQLLELTLFLPAEFGGAVTLTGQVVYVMLMGRPGDTRRIFDTALRFVDVEEQQSESLMKFIHYMQLEQLRRMREHSSPHPADEPEITGWRGFSRRRRVMLMLCAAFSVALLAWIVFALAGYYSSGRKGNIEKTFEEQIRKLINGR